MSIETRTEVHDARWLRFLSRWALVASGVVLAALLIYAIGYGMGTAYRAQGNQFFDLLAAAMRPMVYRWYTAVYALAWFMVGGSLLALAGITWRRTPVRAALIAGAGLVQILGVLGALISLHAVGEFAVRYAAAGANQAAMRDSFLILNQVIYSTFVTAGLIQGLGFLVAASATYMLEGWPRWLSYWLVVSGIIALAFFVVTFVLDYAPLWLFLVQTVIALFGLNLATALAIWSPSPQLVSSTTTSPA